MTPPFPWSLSPRAALRQAAGLLLLFYGVVYGVGALLPFTPLRHGSPLFSALMLGLLMLAAVRSGVRRDVSWRGSLGLGESYVEGWWDCDALDELAHHRQRHVRLQQGHAHFAQHVGNIVVGQEGLAAQVFYDTAETLGKII